MKRLILFLCTIAIVSCAPEPDDPKKNANEAETRIQDAVQQDWKPYAYFSHYQVSSRTIKFKDSCVGIKMLYEFGDGSEPLELYPPEGKTSLSSEDRVFTHKFSEKGEYLVSVSTKNNKGDFVTYMDWVKVEY